LGIAAKLRALIREFEAVPALQRFGRVARIMKSCWRPQAFLAQKKNERATLGDGYAGPKTIAGAGKGRTP
jgi:hypothetical protein